MLESHSQTPIHQQFDVRLKNLTLGIVEVRTSKKKQREDELNPISLQEKSRNQHSYEEHKHS